MPVTEIAVLVAQDPYTNDSPEFVTRIESILERMSAIAKNKTFRVYRQVDDPNKVDGPNKDVYFFGEWPSLEAHAEAWASDEGKAVVADCFAITQLSAMAHIEGPMSALPLDAPFVTVGRWPVTKEKKAEFEEFVAAMMPVVSKYVAPYGTAGSWRLDLDETQKVKGEEEYIGVTGWSSEGSHREFFEASTWTDSASKTTYAAAYRPVDEAHLSLLTRVR